MKKKIISYSPTETKKIGKKFAKEILSKKKAKSPVVISLEGELGGGKTTFLKGFARGLGIKGVIKSPTFVIMRKYKLTTNNKRQVTKSCKLRYFYHIDCYRIENPKEILDLDFKKIVSSPQNIVAIEWSEKIKKILPKNSLRINFQFIGKNTRKIIFKTHG